MAISLEVELSNQSHCDFALSHINRRPTVGEVSLQPLQQRFPGGVVGGALQRFIERQQQASASVVPIKSGLGAGGKAGRTGLRRIGGIRAKAKGLVEAGRNQPFGREVRRDEALPKALYRVRFAVGQEHST